MLSPIIFFYGFLVLVVFALGVAPTALWKRFGGSLSNQALRARQGRMAAHFAQAVATVPFNAEVDYVPMGIGFALDRGHALVFLAGEHEGRTTQEIVPISQLKGYATGVITGGFTDENYVDFFPESAAKWRISCGEDAASAHGIGRLLESLGLAKP